MTSPLRSLPVCLLTLWAVAEVAAYPVDRMAAFQEAPLVVVVCPEGGPRDAAIAFAARLERRRGAPVEVRSTPPEDPSIPTFVLEVVQVVPGREDQRAISLGERRVQLSGSTELLVELLAELSGPPLASETPWAERVFSNSGGRLTVRYHEGSLVAAQIDGFARERLAERDRIAAAIGLDTDPGDLRYVLYETYEEKGIATRSLEDSHLDADGLTIHLVHGWDVRGDDGRELARLLLLRHAGQPATRWLQAGLPLALARTPAPHDAFTRAARLERAGELPSASQIESTAFWERTSQRIAEPAAAAVARELLRRLPPEQVRAVWRASPLERDDMTELRESAAESVRADRDAADGLDRITRERAAAFARGGHRGFCLAHEGYRIHNGYVGATNARSLDHLVGVGCNWISISPYLGFKSTSSPEMGRVNRLHSRPGSETDEHVIQACTYARRRGMDVLLKPHLWSHRGWCGDLRMRSEADWREFFTSYGDFVVHYALLAAEHGIPALAVGNELPGTTLTREEDWRRLIARVRRVYPGKVIYCANWDREFEALPFWDALDACGVSCYFPLSSSQDPSDAELAHGARAIAARLAGVAKRTGRPVIVTELGYAPIQGAWREPFREEGGLFSAQAQERCFAAMLGALRGQDWCLGVYVWKWPSFLGHADADARGYTLFGKPAMRIIEKFFHRG